MKPIPIEPEPGQESVWDYPRPPRVEQSDRHVVVRFGDKVVAETKHAIRVLETSHPPSYYIPPGDVQAALLRAVPGSTLCEWKGQASYFDLLVSGELLSRVAWTYQNPSPTFKVIAGYLAFYPGKVECYVAGERVQPQPGGFYGGWITSDVVGPFKGEPGTHSW